MKEYKCLIFDWDGTLMDSAQKISESIRAAAKDVGLPIPSDAEARNIIGLGLHECMLQLFGSIDSIKIDDMVERYRHHFLVANKTPQPLFAGVREGLNELHVQGVSLCVATGKNRVGLNRVLNAESMHDLFFYSRTADESRSKPHPQMLLDILSFIGIDAEHALMIGDTTYDMEMAQGAGMDAVGVSYGVHKASQLRKQGALNVFHQYSDLHAWLKLRVRRLFDDE